MEAAAQGACTWCGRFEESVVGSDRSDGDTRRGQRGGGDGRGEERVVHSRVRGVRNHRVSRHGPRVCHSPTSCWVEAAVVSAAAVDLAHQPLHLLQGVAQHQDVVSGEKQGGNFGELAHRGSVRIGHDLAEPVHGHVEVVHPFPLAAVNLETDGLHLVFCKEFSVFFGQPSEGLLVFGGEAVEAVQLRQSVDLRGGHCAGEAVH